MDTPRVRRVWLTTGSARIAGLPAGEALLPLNQTEMGCLQDANSGKNKCGKETGATCTGSHGLGECCSGQGWSSSVAWASVQKRTAVTASWKARRNESVSEGGAEGGR